MILFSLQYYFSSFSNGPIVASTRYSAKFLKDEVSRKSIGFFNITFSISVGILCTLIVFLYSSEIVSLIFKGIPTEDIQEILKIYAFIFPINFAISSLIGHLRGSHYFFKFSFISFISQLSSFLSIAILSFFIQNIVVIVSTFVVLRLLVFLTILPFSEFSLTFPNLIIIKKILRFSLWFFFVSILAFALVYLDRFILSKVAGHIIAGKYATLQEVALRSTIIFDSIFSVLLPALSYYWNNKEKFEEVVNFSFKFMAILSFIVSCVAVLYSKEFLSVWMGRDFAEEYYIVFSLLYIAIFFNVPARVIWNSVIATDRPDYIFYTYLMESIFYIPFMLYMINAYGVVGAALSWVVRIFIDMLMLFLFLYLLLRISLGFNLLLTGFALIMVGFLLNIFSCNIYLKSVFNIFSLIFFLFYGWRNLKNEEKIILKEKTIEIINKVGVFRYG